jgi:hypothetical protein
LRTIIKNSQRKVIQIGKGIDQYVLQLLIPISVLCLDTTAPTTRTPLTNPERDRRTWWKDYRWTPRQEGFTEIMMPSLYKRNYIFVSQLLTLTWAIYITFSDHSKQNSPI